jgi:hypothetical protein
VIKPTGVTIRGYGAIGDDDYEAIKLNRNGYIYLMDTNESGNIVLTNKNIYGNMLDYQNVGIGYNVFRNTINTTHDNIMIGAQSGYELTSGIMNINIGTDGMYGLTTGVGNTGLGYNTLSSLAGGSYNLGLGFTAGSYNGNRSNRLYINSIDRSNILGDTTKSIIYGAQSANVADQRLYLNAVTYPYQIVGSGTGIFSTIATNTGTQNRISTNNSFQNWITINTGVQNVSSTNSGTQNLVGTNESAGVQNLININNGISLKIGVNNEIGIDITDKSNDALPIKLTKSGTTNSNRFISLNYKSTEATIFDSLGHMEYTGYPVYNDIVFDATQLKSVGSVGKPDYDVTELGLLFPDNDTTEAVGYTVQIPHSVKTGTINIYPHVHVRQTTADTARFKIKYRAYQVGAEIPSTWTIVETSTKSTTWSSGNIHQVLGFGAVSINSDLSTLIDIIIYRNPADAITGDVLLKQFDIHVPIDKLGSKEEFYN